MNTNTTFGNYWLYRDNTAGVDYILNGTARGAYYIDVWLWNKELLFVNVDSSIIANFELDVNK